jgi:hypothetical protein
MNRKTKRKPTFHLQESPGGVPIKKIIERTLGTFLNERNKKKNEK